MDMKRVYLVFCLAMVFTLAAITPGCDSSMEGYRTFTWNKAAHFSFEYPAHYEKHTARADLDVEDRGIYIAFHDKVPPKGSTYGYIIIIVEGAGYPYPDAEAALEDTLSIFVDQEPYNEDDEQAPGLLLERSSLTVNGIPAELIVYSYGYDRVREESTGLWVYLIRIAREVYFDHDGLIWKIVIESDEDRAQKWLKRTLSTC